jgi:hypothetical protein
MLFIVAGCERYVENGYCGTYEIYSRCHDIDLLKKAELEFVLECRQAATHNLWSFVRASAEVNLEVGSENGTILGNGLRGKTTGGLPLAMPSFGWRIVKKAWAAIMRPRSDRWKPSSSLVW